MFNLQGVSDFDLRFSHEVTMNESSAQIIDNITINLRKIVQFNLICVDTSLFSCNQIVDEICVFFC